MEKEIEIQQQKRDLRDKKYILNKQIQKVKKMLDGFSHYSCCRASIFNNQIDYETSNTKEIETYKIFNFQSLIEKTTNSPKGINENRICIECKGKLCITCENSHDKELIEKNNQKKKEKLLLVGSSDGRVIKFNPRTMENIKQYYVSDREGNIYNLLTSKENTIAGIYYDNIKIWNKRKLNNLRYNYTCRYSCDIKYLKNNLIGIASYNPNKCILLDVSDATTKLTCTIKNSYPNALCKIDDTKLLIGFGNGLIKYWDTYNNKLFYLINAHPGMCINSVNKLTFSTGSFVSVGTDDCIKFWNLNSINKNISEITNKRINEINVFKYDFSKLKELSDGRIAYATKDYSVSIWDLNSLTNIEIKGHALDVFDIFQMSDNLVLTCSQDNTIRKWDLRYSSIPVNILICDAPILKFEDDYKNI